MRIYQGLEHEIAHAQRGGSRLRRAWTHQDDGPDIAGPHWRGGYIAAVAATTVEVGLWKLPGTQTVDRALLPADVPALVDEPLACRCDDTFTIVEVRRGARPSGGGTYGCLNGCVEGISEWQNE